jgi:hypothetical protein
MKHPVQISLMGGDRLLVLNLRRRPEATRWKWSKFEAERRKGWAVVTRWFFIDFYARRA